jgi:hypothetical protein
VLTALSAVNGLFWKIRKRVGIPRTLGVAPRFARGTFDPEAAASRVAHAPSRQLHACHYLRRPVFSPALSVKTINS